jgi:uncharacterized small protein (DUF1192 family)
MSILSRSCLLLGFLLGASFLMLSCADEPGAGCPDCPAQAECRSSPLEAPQKVAQITPTAQELESLCVGRIQAEKGALTQEIERLQAELAAARPPVPTTWMARAEVELGTLDLVLECDIGGTRLVDPATGRAMSTSKVSATDCAVHPGVNALFLQLERKENGDPRYDLYAQDLSAMEPPFLILAGASVPIQVNLGDWRGMPGDHNDLGVEFTVARGDQGPPVSFQSGNYCQIDEAECEAHEARSKTLKPTPEADRLMSWLGRDKGTPKDRSPSRSHVDLPPLPGIPKSGCEERSLCGETTSIPSTHMLLVLVSHSCGDGCYLEYCLFDPVARVFVDARKPTKRAERFSGVTWSHFEGLAVSADGARYVLDGCVRSWTGEFEYCCKGTFGGFIRGTNHLP